MLIAATVVLVKVLVVIAAALALAGSVTAAVVAVVVLMWQECRQESGAMTERMQEFWMFFASSFDFFLHFLLQLPASSQNCPTENSGKSTLKWRFGSGLHVETTGNREVLRQVFPSETIYGCVE